MAVAVSNLTKGGSSTGATSYATASVTFTAGRFYLAVFASRTGITADPTQPTASGGLTWTVVPTNGSVVYDNTSSSRKRLTLFYALAASTVSSAVTFDEAGQTQTHGEWIIDEITGTDNGGVQGINNIVQSAKNFDGSATAATITATLAAFASANNATYGAFGEGNGGVWTAGSGMGINVQDNTSVAVAIMSEFASGNVTSVSATDNANSELGVIALELRTAAIVAIPKLKPQTPILNGSHAITKGLILDVPLFENGGINAVNLVNRKNGTLTSSPTWVRTPYGSALNFVHANGSYVKVSTAKTLAGLLNWTLMVIYNSNTSSAVAQDEDLYCERGSSGNDIFKLENRSAENVIWFRYRDDAATLNNIQGVTSPNDSKYHVWIVTKAGTTATLYLDGVQNAQTTFTATDTFTDATLDTRIGSDQADATKAIDGTIPLVRGWNRVLTTSEIRQIIFDPWQIYVKPNFTPFYFSPAAAVAGANSSHAMQMGMGM